MELALILIAYFIPVIIAVLRGHRNTMPILLTTVLFGWAIIPWWASLIWAFSSNTKKNHEYA